MTVFTSSFETTLWNITNTRIINRLSTMKHMLNVWSESLKKWVHFMTKFCWRKILKMLKTFWRICFNVAINRTITLNIFVITLKYSNCWIRNCQVIVLKSHSCLKILDVRSIFKKKRRIWTIKNFKLFKIFFRWISAKKMRKAKYKKRLKDATKKC